MDERAPRRTGAVPVDPQDAALWCATTDSVQLQIGAICRFDGAGLRDADGAVLVDDLRDHVASRLHLLPRFRSVLHRVPLDLARPVWVDDTDFDLDRHLWTGTVRSPGGPDELRRVVAELFSRPLDIAHPLWELAALDGLADGDVAVVLRASHVLADGLSLLRAATALLDVEPATDTPPPVPWRPTRRPSTAALLAEQIAARRRRQVDLGVAAARLAAAPGRVAQLARAGLGAVVPPPHPAPPLPVTGRGGPSREVRWTSVPLAPLTEIAHRHGATLNDVALTVVAGALRRTLGPGAAGLVPQVLVPVGDAVPGAAGNLFSFVVTGLPVGTSDPHAVLAEVHDRMERRKQSLQAAAVSSIFSLVDLVPVALLRRAAPAVLGRQPFVNLVVTNLPGSAVPLYLRGARLREVHPVITGIGNVACIVGVMSYCDQLGLSVTVDPDVVDDPDGLLAALDESAAEVAACAPTARRRTT